MKITTNRAIKYRNLLAASIDRMSSMERSVNIRCHDDASSIRKEFHEGVKDFEANVATVVKDISSLYDLRNLIDVANSNGISELQNRIVALQAEANFLSKLVAPPERYGRTAPAEELEVVLNDVMTAVAMSEKDATKVVPFKTRTINVMDEVLTSSYLDKIAQIKQEIEELKEKRNALNLEVFIELPSEIVEALKRHRVA